MASVHPHLGECFSPSAVTPALPIDVRCTTPSSRNPAQYRFYGDIRSVLSVKNVRRDDAPRPHARGGARAGFPDFSWYAFWYVRSLCAFRFRVSLFFRRYGWIASAPLMCQCDLYPRARFTRRRVLRSRSLVIFIRCRIPGASIDEGRAPAGSTVRGPYPSECSVRHL